MTAYANGARIAELADQARRAVSIESMADRAGVKLRRTGSELRGSCPLCGAGQGSKSVFAVKGDKWRCYGCGLRGDVIDLVMELDGVSFMEAVRRLVGRIDLNAPARNAAPVRQKPEGPSAADRVALEIWREVKPFPGTLAETYLRRRGICAEVLERAGSRLRFHPNAKHSWDKRRAAWRTAPAMVVQVVTPAGPTGGVHVTYLDRASAGKAVFHDDDGEAMPAKRMWGPQVGADGARGGAWLIGPDGEGDLVVAEGIETGLSVATLSAQAGIPSRVVAALSLLSLQGLWKRDEDNCVDPTRIEADPNVRAFSWPTPEAAPWREVLVAVDRDMGDLKVKARTGRGKICPFLLTAEVRARLCGRLAVAAWKAAGAPRARAIAPAPGRDFNDELRARLARGEA